MIDYKNGKVIWDNSHNWEKDDRYYDYDQDILQVKYGENCIIDVGNYPNEGNGRRFVILVIDFTPYPEDNEDRAEAWSHPYAVITCPNKADLLVQLQRAIDVYPTLIS